MSAKVIIHLSLLKSWNSPKYDHPAVGVTENGMVWGRGGGVWDTQLVDQIFKNQILNLKMFCLWLIIFETGNVEVLYLVEKVKVESR